MLDSAISTGKSTNPTDHLLNVQFDTKQGCYRDILLQEFRIHEITELGPKSTYCIHIADISAIPVYSHLLKKHQVRNIESVISE